MQEKRKNCRYWCDRRIIHNFESLCKLLPCTRYVLMRYSFSLLEIPETGEEAPVVGDSSEACQVEEKKFKHVLTLCVCRCSLLVIVPVLLSDKKGIFRVVCCCSWSVVRVLHHRHCKSQIFHQPVVLNTAWRSLRHDQNFIDVSENKFIIRQQESETPVPVNKICGVDVECRKFNFLSIWFFFCQNR